MGMTMTQKILAAHAGLDHVEAGQLIMADLDVVMANDITGQWRSRCSGRWRIRYMTGKVVLVPDHFTPNKESNPRRMQRLCGSLQRSRS